VDDWIAFLDSNRGISPPAALGRLALRNGAT
jgi:hypothetical protein